MHRFLLPVSLLVVVVSVTPVLAGDIRADGRLVSGATAGPPLEVGSTERVDNLNAQYLDGLGVSDLALAAHTHAGSGYANVLVVSPQGGDFTSIQAAIDQIGDASAENRYLVWIGPGIYEETVTTKTGVDLQGAGQGLSVVRGSFHSADFTPDAGLVTLAPDSALRNLSVENEVSGALDTTVLAFALVVQGGSASLEDLTVRSSVTCDLASADFRAQAVQVAAGSPRLSRVTLEAMVTGEDADGFCNAVAFSTATETTPEAEDSRFVASTLAPVDPQSVTVAVEVTGNSLMVVRDSVLSASGGNLSNKAFNLPGPSSTPEARVAHSQVIGSVPGSGLICVGAYDEAFAALDAGCL